MYIYTISFNMHTHFKINWINSSTNKFGQLYGHQIDENKNHDAKEKKWYFLHLSIKYHSCFQNSFHTIYPMNDHYWARKEEKGLTQ